MNSQSSSKMNRAEMAPNLPQFPICSVGINYLCLHECTKVLFCFKRGRTNEPTVSGV